MTAESPQINYIIVIKYNCREDMDRLLFEKYSDAQRELQNILDNGKGSDDWGLSISIQEGSVASVVLQDPIKILWANAELQIMQNKVNIKANEKAQKILGLRMPGGDVTLNG